MTVIGDIQNQVFKGKDHILKGQDWLQVTPMKGCVHDD